MNNNVEKTFMPLDYLKTVQGDSSKKLKEMVSFISVDDNENKLGRNMVEVVDNTKPRIMCKSDMCHYVDNSVSYLPIPNIQEIKNVNRGTSLPSVPMFFSDSSFVFENGILFCNNVAFLNCTIEITEIVQSENQEYYRCRIYLKGKYIVKNVKPTDFLLGKWVFGVAGVATVGDRSIATKCLNQYLDFLVHNLDLSNKSNMYQKPGWQIVDGMFYYVTKQGVIDSSSIRAVSECGQNFDKLIPDFNCFTQYLNMINVTTSNVAAIIVLYTAMSLCNTLFKRANFTKFLLFVYGLRGNFKTSLSLALSQVEYRDVPLFTLKATKAGIESGFRNYRDSVMLVDDLAPTQELSDRKKMQSTLETIVRAFGDGTSHRRCVLQYSDDKANRVGQYEAEGGCIITGEYYTGCESSLARCLFVELKKENVNLELLSFVQENRHVVENFAVCFIACLTRLINDCQLDIVGFIETRGKELRKKYSFKYTNQRYSEYQAQLQLTSELLMLVAGHFKLLSSQEISMYIQRFSSAILEVIESNNTRLVAQNPTTILCEALKSAIEDEKILYCALGSVVPDYDKVIFYKDGYLYISQKGYANLVNEYIKENDINLAEFTSTRVATTLENSHIISACMEGATKRYAVKISGYGSKRFMKLSRVELEKHVSF